VVAGGQGPGKRDQESLDRDRARLPLAAAKNIVVLGCHGGAGQTTTALVTARMLASLRGHPVAALDLSTANNAATKPGTNGTTKPGTRTSGGNLDIIAGDNPDYKELAENYPLTIIDPAPSAVTRVLGIADQLVIVVPPTAEAASSLANTQQWLDAHGHADLAARAVTVLNDVAKNTMTVVQRAESVARGRCRAIVRVPHDDQLTPPPKHPQVPQTPQTRLAYTALAGIIVAGLAAPAPGTGRSPGEHEG
jgi:cellulose biosynthesis protein BcsQ